MAFNNTHHISMWISKLIFVFITFFVAHIVSSPSPQQALLVSNELRASVQQGIPPQFQRQNIQQLQPHQFQPPRNIGQQPQIQQQQVLKSSAAIIELKFLYQRPSLEIQYIKKKLRLVLSAACAQPQSQSRAESANKLFVDNSTTTFAQFDSKSRNEPADRLFTRSSVTRWTFN